MNTELIKTIKKNLLFILIVTILASFVAYLSTSFVKSGVRQDQVLFLKSQSESIENYSVDLQALTDTAVAMISSPDFQNSNTKGASITVKKLAPQVISLSAISSNAETSLHAVEESVNKFNSISPTLIKNTNAELVSLGEMTAPEKKIVNSKLLTMLGALSGFIISLSIVFASKYLKL